MRRGSGAVPLRRISVLRKNRFSGPFVFILVPCIKFNVVGIRVT